MLSAHVAGVWEEASPRGTQCSPHAVPWVQGKATGPTTKPERRQ